MRCKNKVLTHFQTLVAMIQNIFHHTIQFLKATMGQNMSIMHFLIIVNPWKLNKDFHTPQQNGFVERKHHHIATMTHSLLLTSGAPYHLWVEVVLTYVYLINLLPTRTLNWDTPHTRLYSSPSLYSSFHVFGSSCFPHLGSYVSDKLSSCSIECIFLG
jgi:hypothetical protein